MLEKCATLGFCALAGICLAGPVLHEHQLLLPIMIGGVIGLLRRREPW